MSLALLAWSVMASEEMLESKLAKAISNGDLDGIGELVQKVEHTKVSDHTGKNALMVAAKAGHVVLVKKLLAIGADPLAKNFNGGTPLMFACISGNTELIDLFLDRNADINLRGSNGWGALMIAAAKGHADATMQLLQRGADVNTRDVYQWTPLHRAAYQNRPEIVMILLQSKHTRIDALDDQGATALHHAAARGWDAVAKILLEHGADAALVDADGRTPLNYAAERGHSNVARLLHRARASKS